MALFVYIGDLTKDNNRIDITIPTKNGRMRFKNIRPHQNVIETDDRRAIFSLENTVGIDGKRLYKEIKILEDGMEKIKGNL